MSNVAFSENLNNNTFQMRLQKGFNPTVIYSLGLLSSCWVLNLDQRHLLTCVRPDVWSFVIVLLLPFGGPFIADQYNKSCVFGPRGRNLKWRFYLSIHSGQFHLTNHFLLATKVVLAFWTLFLSQSIFSINCEFRWNNEMHA